jgi:ribosome-associated protein
MKAIYLARKVAKIAWAKKAEEVLIIDLRGLTDVADFFVIATGTVGMHVRAITDFVVDEVRLLGEKPYVTEKESDQWMIADFVDVTFHCFQPAKRTIYNLERLWCEGLVMRVDPVSGSVETLKDAKAKRKLLDEKLASTQQVV